MIVTVVAIGTVDVSTTNVALRDPGKTRTVAGTLAIVELLLVSCTSAPPSGAVAASVTVACGCPWPWIVCGLTDNELPGLPGAGAGDGDGAGAGAGDGAGDTVGDGDVGADEPPPHCATANVTRASAGIVSSRCVRIPSAPAESVPL